MYTETSFLWHFKAEILAFLKVKMVDSSLLHGDPKMDSTECYLYQIITRFRSFMGNLLLKTWISSKVSIIYINLNMGVCLVDSVV